MISDRNIAAYVGTDLRGGDGERIGKIARMYVDPKTGRANWATIKTGFLGTSRSFVPLTDAEEDAEGRLTVPYSSDIVRKAPRIRGDADLTGTEERELTEYFRTARRG